jgi:hypothetical protein
MLVIPAPVDGATTLDILIVEDPAAAGVPAATPEFANRLRDRWHGATLHRDPDGALFVRLPLTARWAGKGGSVNALIHAAQARYQAWCEDGRPPVTVWNRMGRHRLVIGGGRRSGWMLVPRVSLNSRQLTVGVTWQTHAFEDPDPIVSLHIPGICLWARAYRVHAGFRDIPRDQHDHPGQPGQWKELA